MKSFESYKYRANNLRIFGIALMTPFATIIHQVIMTKLNFTDMVNIYSLASVLMFAIGFFNIYLGIEILEKCDYEFNRATC